MTENQNDDPRSLYVCESDDPAQQRSLSERDDIRSDFRLSNDGDGFGNCMAWLFPIAIELDLRESTAVPAEWQYRAGAMGSHHEPDCYVAECLQAYSDETILQFGNVLSRYQNKLHAADLTY